MIITKKNVFSYFRFYVIQSGFEFECFYDALFGEDSSDESSAKDEDCE